MVHLRILKEKRQINKNWSSLKMKVEWRDTKWLQTKLKHWILLKDQSQISTT